jgi:hypothetical protein
MVLTISAVTNSLESFCREKQSNCGYNRKDGACWVYDSSLSGSIQEFFDSFPSFTFLFGDSEDTKDYVPYELRGMDYLYQENGGSAQWCLGIQKFGYNLIIFHLFSPEIELFWEEHF